MNTYIAIMAPKCDSCGRPESEYTYVTFRSEETAILTKLDPSFMQLNGMSTTDALSTMRAWLAQLLAKPLDYGGPVEERRYGVWTEYGRVIDNLTILCMDAQEIKGKMGVAHRD